MDLRSPVNDNALCEGLAAQRPAARRRPRNLMAFVIFILFAVPLVALLALGGLFLNMIFGDRSW